MIRPGEFTRKDCIAAVSKMETVDKKEKEHEFFHDD